MKKKQSMYIILLSVLFCVHLSTVHSQTSVREYGSYAGVGGWKDHLPYSHALKVTESASKIYCSTDLSLFAYNKNDHSVEKFSKVTGLSDVEISTIKYSEVNNILLIAYKNANTDILQDNKIYNIADIKNKQIIGGKIINNITFLNNLAYLSCGFGIVVLDLSKKEIKDTYYIGDGGSHVNVFDLACDDDYFYAATEMGIYRAEKDNPNLINYIYWDRMVGFADFDGAFNTIVAYNGKIFANRSNSTTISDIVYVFDGLNWDIFFNETLTNYSLNNSNENLLIVSSNEVKVFNITLAETLSVMAYNFGSVNARDALYGQNNIVWIADNYYGLVKYTSSSSESIYPDGPFNEDAMAMSVEGSKLYIAGGGLDLSWNNVFRSGEIYSYIDSKWSSIINYSIRDVVNILVDPANHDHIYAASWGYGLLEYNNGVLTNTFDITNSAGHTLQSIIPGDNYIRIKGIAFDAGHNLWITNSGVTNPVSVKKNDGSWASLPYGSIINSNIVGDIIITQNGHKWTILPRGEGLFAFDDNSTIDDPDDDKTKKFSILDNNGKLITNEIYSIAESLSGNIWVGTNMGVVAYYSPENVFSNEGFYAQRITIPDESGEFVNYLLGKETITSIAVDGADRKWLGTSNSGVFLVSKDGSEEVLHFNKNNSPLLSNVIKSITINHSTGDVYFGTDKGIVSYKGSATKGGSDFGKVYAFPNPVRQDYEGDITVTGLIEGAIIKITDITGNLVYETRALGGQAFWKGQDLSGKKVHTGVYLIFCSNEDGSKTFVTKLLFIR